MTTRMLIDARHREETRVAVTKGNRIEEFDFESAEHKQLKGNIYLAKVTRVEPSLQAAFVEYGGNRHGFLAFSEIHPDYYQIPKEDREALLREEAEHAAAAMRAEEDLDELEGDVEVFDDDNGERPAAPELISQSDNDDDSDGESDGDDQDSDSQDDDSSGDGSDSDADGDSNGESHSHRRRQNGRRGRGRGRGRRYDEDSEGEKPMSLRRRYKIQDVIRRRQVMLVQVVKEERGNKGAALTTYLSLAGRYCVLMPNTMNGGGISRKISNSADRRKLKAMVDEMNLPPSMGCIVRTAGMSRTKTEIKRDFDYLARLWDEIRERTLHSSAPALIHTDSDLIKRAIRDIYHRDIEEVLVEGEEGYLAAKQFMKLLMPSHARKVKQYADPISLYQRCGVEDQLNGMLNPVVQLKSGGYLVINPTEALVSIDINSGRSTREHNIEQTALSTNLEAAHEIARQLRLRDMAGLIVIDFIDMDHNSNIRKVERAMKEALKNDRARIQIGRISGFGLMEMSRQRLRTGVLEASTRACPHCDGTGLVRTASSAGLSALRLIEEEAARGRGSRILLRASQEATFYLLNEKRSELRDIETLYGVSITILPGEENEGGHMSIEASGPPPLIRPTFAPVQILEDEDEDYEDELDNEEADESADEAEADDSSRSSASSHDDGDHDGEGRKRRRRRRGRRGRREDEQGDSASDHGDDPDDLAAGDHHADMDNGENGSADEADSSSSDAVDANDAAQATDDAPAEESKPRRRRGGRGRRKPDNGAASTEEADGVTTAEAADASDASEAQPSAGKVADDAPAADPVEAPKAEAEGADTKAEPKAAAEPAAPAVAAQAAAQPAAEADAPAVTADPVAEVPAPEEKPKRAPRKRKTAAEKAAEEAAAAAAAGDEATAETAPAAAPAKAKPAAKAADKAADGEAPKKRAPRKRKTAAEKAAEEAAAAALADGATTDDAAKTAAAETAAEPEKKAAAKPAVRRTRAKRVVAAPATDEAAPAATTEAAPEVTPAPAAPAPTASATPAPSTTPDASTPSGEDNGDGSAAAPRRGWWQRTFGE